MPTLELPEQLWPRLVRVAERAGLSPRGGIPLENAVKTASALYTGERSEIPHKASDGDILAARLLFFAVRDFSKVVEPLEELWRAGFQPKGKTLRVLDVGAGVGASGLGVARFAALHGIPRVALTAFDRDAAALSVARRLFDDLGSMDGFFAPVTLETRQGSAARDAELPEGPFDLVVASFVLNEMLLGLPPDRQAAEGASLLRSFFRRLAPHGALVVLEPALKTQSRTLSAVRDVLVASQEAPSVVAPCLHAGPCPMLAGERDWCHQEIARALPAPWDRIARGAGLRFEGLSYSYLTLQNAGGALGAPPPGALRVVSDALVTKGKRELFGCGDDGRLVRLTRLDREASDDNEDFERLRRGDVFELHDAAPKGPGLRVLRETKVRLREPEG